MNRTFYTLYDPAEDVYWNNDKTTTANVMNATWFRYVSDAEEALRIANGREAFQSLRGTVPYEIVKPTLVSERLI